MRSTQGSVARDRLTEIPLTGKPPTTERFTTRVRVKSPQKQSAPIEISIHDPRGQVVMSARGEVSFRGVKGDEADYLVDWEPTPWPAGGRFEARVTIAGRQAGSYPVQFAAR